MLMWRVNKQLAFSTWHLAMQASGFFPRRHEPVLAKCQVLIAKRFPHCKRIQRQRPQQISPHAPLDLRQAIRQ
jgi:hypothetical protein